MLSPFLFDDGAIETGHAIISLAHGQVSLIHHAREGTTRVNGQPLQQHEHVQLHHDHTIEIGYYEPIDDAYIFNLSLRILLSNFPPRISPTRSRFLSRPSATFFSATPLFLHAIRMLHESEERLTDELEHTKQRLHETLDVTANHQCVPEPSPLTYDALLANLHVRASHAHAPHVPTPTPRPDYGSASHHSESAITGVSDEIISNDSSGYSRQKRSGLSTADALEVTMARVLNAWRAARHETIATTPSGGTAAIAVKRIREAWIRARRDCLSLPSVHHRSDINHLHPGVNHQMHDHLNSSFIPSSGASETPIPTSGPTSGLISGLTSKSPRTSHRTLSTHYVCSAPVRFYPSASDAGDDAYFLTVSHMHSHKDTLAFSLSRTPARTPIQPADLALPTRHVSHILASWKRTVRLGSSTSSSIPHRSRSPSEHGFQRLINRQIRQRSRLFFCVDLNSSAANLLPPSAMPNYHPHQPWFSLPSPVGIFHTPVVISSY